MTLHPIGHTRTYTKHLHQSSLYINPVRSIDNHCSHISNQTIDSLDTVSITFLHPTQPRMSVCLLYLFLLPAATLGRTTDSSGCIDNGCVSYYGGDAECVNVRHGNWSQIGRQYLLGTVDKDGLCQSQHYTDDCCRCLPIRTTTTTTTTTTSTTTTTTSTTTTTTSTSTTPPPVCTDVHGSCRAAFNGSGACIDVRQGDLTYIDIDVDPLDGHCSTGPDKCCECFRIKTEGKLCSSTADDVCN